MPKRISPEELSALIAAAEAMADGLSRKEAEHLLPHLSSRTVLRRLTTLVDEGRLLVVGAGPAARYRVAQERETAADVEEGGTTLAEPPFSAQAAEVRTLVERPLISRTPIGYQRRFLDDYRPNQTWYLPAGLREELYGLGRAPGGDRAAEPSPARFSIVS